MKKMYVKRLLAAITIGTVLSGSVTACGMSNMAATAKEEAPSAASETAAESYDYEAEADEGYYDDPDYDESDTSLIGEELEFVIDANFEQYIGE